MNNYVENFYPDHQGHGLTEDLAGKAVRLHYRSGHVLEQHWLSASEVLWKAIAGPLAGHSQKENYRAFAIAEDIYLISWMEAATSASAGASMKDGPWLTDVVLDFRRMKATASWTGPTPAGGVEHVLDQADMEYLVLDS